MKCCGKAYSLREADEIRTPPIRTAISYAVTFHELGHMLGRHQRAGRDIVRERWAWIRARANAPRWSGAPSRHLLGKSPRR